MREPLSGHDRTGRVGHLGRDVAVMLGRNPAVDARAKEQRHARPLERSVRVAGRERRVGLHVIEVGEDVGRVVHAFDELELVGLRGQGGVVPFEPAAGRPVADDHAGCRVVECAVAFAVEGYPVGWDARHAVLVCAVPCSRCSFFSLGAIGD